MKGWAARAIEAAESHVTSGQRTDADYVLRPIEMGMGLCYAVSYGVEPVREKESAE